MGLLLLGCFALPAAKDSTSTEDSAVSGFENDFLRAHNEARAQASPTPDPPLPDLVWDAELATLAADWAAGCVFEHSTGETGENLAIFSYSVEPAEVVDLWFSEISDYNYNTNRCAAGAQCGHYTQLVWRDTQKVGCARQTCDSVPDFGPGELWVCEYDPAGNWVGEKPY